MTGLPCSRPAGGPIGDGMVDDAMTMALLKHWWAREREALTDTEWMEIQYDQALWEDHLRTPFEEVVLP